MAGPNSRHTLYRVNYDEENWRLISETLNHNTAAIPPFNRAQIICDVFHLAKTGDITEYVKEMVLSYYPTEWDFTPILAYRQCSNEFENSNSELRKI